MADRKTRRNMLPDRSGAPSEPRADVALCRYEELALRENRLRQTDTAKPARRS